MTEKLLQFIWQFQYFNKTNLLTESGEVLQIIFPGQINTQQGPDFLQAKIKVNNILLAGNVELHCLSSDWEKHNHATDKNYSNIILHVVWENNFNLKNTPTLCLQPRVTKILLQQYENLMNNQLKIPCYNLLPVLNEFEWLSWKERLAIERMEIKAQQILQLFVKNNNNWEETFWQLLAYNFGLKVNAEIFMQMANCISINILAKHKNQIYQLEALLLGTVNLLNDDFVEDYPKLLQKEYKFLQKKYQLANTYQTPFFLRMRPANFPTIRLAQLAKFIQQSKHLFSVVKETENLKEIKTLLNIEANDYWNNHYVFDKPTKFKHKQLGNAMSDAIIINTFIPVLFAYGLYTQDEKYKQKALQWLMQLPAECNSITNVFESKNIKNKSALDSQAFIHLKNNYCNKKLCLQCAVGNKLMKQK
ncbi:MAG: DUF2851 family protein [Bacteroidetes bacterium]|nr:DUF2851 family protein [Bacteroidota bacterium]MBS1642224.1 DUF2851 family protein [Bacteroidota bacterium]MBS1672226.1 DUF2851 family protein [Bacteroidota bacterium]